MLCPDPLLQLSPAYQPADTVADLVAQGVLHPRCADLFRVHEQTLRLHQHQRTAIDLAAQRLHYVVTTGTGSGKSLTYLIPIIDHVLREHPERGQMRAIIVYPMNALINSQLQALERFASNLDEPCPVRFARYTGQENEAEKAALRQDPPHIILTNYVMLELMLTRPEERPFVDATHSAIQFLVLDELHTYRGRQGADVAFLVRRLRERCGNAHLQCIGTSATMATGTTRTEHAAVVAAVASTLFGAPITTEQVIDETLRWSVPQPGAPSVEELRAALQAPPPAVLDWATLMRHPLAAWIEATIGLRTEADGRLRRREPLTLADGAQRLAAQTGASFHQCRPAARNLTYRSAIMSKLDVSGIFKSYADELIKTREEAIKVHGSNIRAAGNNVEISVRESLSKMLPRQFYVTSGHLIDVNENISNQLDIIISDTFGLPSLLRTKDGTEYVPIDSVYAVGEVKSTYYKGSIEHFGDIVSKIRDDLHHEEVINTAFNGVERGTAIRDIILEKKNKVLNRTFYFMVFVNSGNFEFEDVCVLYNQRDKKNLPDMVVLLNKGVIVYAKEEDGRFLHSSYPEQQEDDNYDWYFFPFEANADSGSLEGNHLGFLYYSILEHLVNSHLEPPTLFKYIAQMLAVKKSLLKTARDTSNQNS